MSWSIDARWTVVGMAAQALAMLALLTAGVLLLRRSRSSIILLRASVACSIALSTLSLAMSLYDNSIYASYWSTPATAAVNALQFLSGFWLPVLLVLLTLPPLARRMV
jgi:carbon starvation protein CstA